MKTKEGQITSIKIASGRGMSSFNNSFLIEVHNVDSLSKNKGTACLGETRD